MTGIVWQALSDRKKSNNEDEEKAEVIFPEGGPVECIHWEED